MEGTEWEEREREGKARQGKEERIGLQKDLLNPPLSVIDT